MRISHRHTHCIARTLRPGFDVRTGLMGAVGQDEWGGLFVNSMKRWGGAVQDECS
jgi:sugar/nucleoside kinase (ribokinase family)